MSAEIQAGDLVYVLDEYGATPAVVFAGFETILKVSVELECGTTVLTVPRYNCLTQKQYRRANNIERRLRQ